MRPVPQTTTGTGRAGPASSRAGTGVRNHICACMWQLHVECQHRRHTDVGEHAGLCKIVVVEAGTDSQAADPGQCLKTLFQRDGKGLAAGQLGHTSGSTGRPRCLWRLRECSSSALAARRSRAWKHHHKMWRVIPATPADQHRAIQRVVCATAPECASTVFRELNWFTVVDERLSSSMQSVVLPGTINPAPLLPASRAASHAAARTAARTASSGTAPR